MGIAGPSCRRLHPRLNFLRLDAETRLDYFGARYYSAAQGRFTSADKPFADQHMENPQSWNLYAYVRNNPLTYVDPDGQKGHHVVPQFLWINSDIGPEAKAFLKDFTIEFPGHMNSKAHDLYNVIAEEIWDNYLSENKGRFFRGQERTLATMTQKDAIEITRRFTTDARISKLIPELLEQGAKQTARLTVRSELGALGEKVGLGKVFEKEVVRMGLGKALGIALSLGITTVFGELFSAEPFSIGADCSQPGTCGREPEQQQDLQHRSESSDDFERRAVPNIRGNTGKVGTYCGWTWAAVRAARVKNGSACLK